MTHLGVVLMLSMTLILDFYSLSIFDQGISSKTTSLVDGVLTCSFERLKAADGERFALDQTYTLFWASGDTGAGSELFWSDLERKTYLPK